MAACQNCKTPTWGTSTWCSNCRKLRDQHATSHTMEGHSHPIRLCPVCDKVFGEK